MMKPRPTDAEFDELKRQRDADVARMIADICAKHGWDASSAHAHVSHTGSAECYCACPDGPCQHVWDGEWYVSEDDGLHSATCSRCGAIAAYHDMRCGP
jgi:hypothetical protein